MASPFFRADHTTSATIQTDIADIITIVEDLQKTLGGSGALHKVIENVTTKFHNNVNKLDDTFSRSRETFLDDFCESIQESMEVFRDLVQLSSNLRSESSFNQQSTDGDAASDDVDNIYTTWEDVFSLIPPAAKQLMDTLSACERDSSRQRNLMVQAIGLWTSWQLHRQDINYDVDEFDDMLCLGHGSTATVYAASLSSSGPNVLEVAMKTRPMTSGNIPKALR